MKNQHNNIDELFKSELSGLETIAPAFVKKQINKKLFFKNKHLLLLFIPTIVLISVLFFSTNRHDDIKIAQSINTIQGDIKIENLDIIGLTVTKKTDPTFKHQNKTENTTNQPPSIIENKNTTLNHTLSKSKNTSTVPMPFTNKNNLTTSLTNNNNNRSVDSKKISNTSLLNTNLTNITKTQSRKENSKTNKSKKAPINDTNQLVVDEENNTNQIITPTGTEITSSKKQYESNHKKSVKEFNLTKEVIQTNRQSKKPKDITRTHLKEDTRNESELKKEIDSISTTNSENLDIQKKITTIPKPKNLSLLVSWTSGLNLSKSTYSATNSSDANYYQDNNNDQLNFEHNLSANLLLKSNFMIGSGIGISKQSYAYSYNKTSTSSFKTIDSSLVISSYIYGLTDTLQEFPPIDTIFQLVYDTITTTSSTKTPFNGKSQAQYIHIPIQIGYIYKANKFMFGIQLNARYNILYKSSGQSFEDNSVTDFDKTNSIFKTSYFDFALKGDVYYNIFNQFYVNGSIKYSPQTNNTYQNISIERKLKYIHFGLGISYKL